MSTFEEEQKTKIKEMLHIFCNTDTFSASERESIRKKAKTMLCKETPTFTIPNETKQLFAKMTPDVQEFIGHQFFKDKKTSKMHDKGKCIVPIRNDHRHKYPLYLPIEVSFVDASDDTARAYQWGTKKEEGNWLRYDEVRPATEEEIIALIVSRNYTNSDNL